MNDISFSIMDGEIWIDSKPIPKDRISEVLRPIIRYLNLMMVSAHTRTPIHSIQHGSHYKKPSLQELTQQIGAKLNLRTRLSESNMLEVYCEETKVWKQVDKLEDSDCTECKKAKIINQVIREMK